MCEIHILQSCVSCTHCVLNTKCSEGRLQCYFADLYSRFLSTNPMDILERMELKIYFYNNQFKLYSTPHKIFTQK